MLNVRKITEKCEKLHWSIKFFSPFNHMNFIELRLNANLRFSMKQILTVRSLLEIPCRTDLQTIWFKRSSLDLPITSKINFCSTQSRVLCISKKLFNKKKFQSNFPPWNRNMVFKKSDVLALKPFSVFFPVAFSRVFGCQSLSFSRERVSFFVFFRFEFSNEF